MCKYHYWRKIVSMTTGKSKPTTPQPPLEDVVEENKQVVEEIHDAAQELAVVHAVLATETMKAKPSDDTKEAVKRTKEVKTKLKATASKLAEATEVLEKHVAKLAHKP